MHAATLSSSTTTTTTTSSSNKGGSSKKKKAGVVGLRGLSVEGNPALGTFGVQVRLTGGYVYINSGGFAQHTGE